jgi:hypothetical protein
MNNEKQDWMNLALAPSGGLLGAIIGGILWAKWIQWTGYNAGWVAIAIGLLTGFGVLLTSKSRRLSVSMVAALFAILGILIGKYLDVRWNAPSIVGVIEINEEIPPEYAESIAKMYESSESGGSVWKKMQLRMEWFDAIFYFVAAFIAFRVARSWFLHQLFFRLE